MSGSLAPGTQAAVDMPPGTQAITRALNVLECFLTSNDLGLTELSALVNLSPSTTHRIVKALVVRGYLDQDPVTERYFLGRSTLVLGQTGWRRFSLDRALPILERFGRETGESINMGLLDGAFVVVTLRVVSPQPLRFEQPVGTKLPVHCSSMGKALLAFDASNGPSDLTSLNLVKVTENSIGSLEELQSDIDEARENGFSTDNEESILGVSCIGAPVLDGSGRAAAAIAVQAPTARMTPNRSAVLSVRIREVAAEVATAMQLDSSASGLSYR